MGIVTVEPIMGAALDSTGEVALRRRRRVRVVALVVVIFVLSPLSALVIRQFIPARSAVIGQAHVSVSAAGGGGATAGMSAPPTMSPELAVDLVAYLDNEGPERRGPKFEQLALRLDAERTGSFGPKVRTVGEPEMFYVLGPPDLFLDESGNRMYVYFYDRFGKKDSFALIALDDKRNIRQIGWNAGNAADFSSLGWKKFPATAPTTAVTGD